MYNSLKEVLGMHLSGISNKLVVLSQCSTLKEALAGHTLLAVALEGNAGPEGLCSREGTDSLCWVCLGVLEVRLVLV